MKLIQACGSHYFLHAGIKPKTFQMPKNALAHQLTLSSPGNFAYYKGNNPFHIAHRRDKNSLFTVLLKVFRFVDSVRIQDGAFSPQFRVLMTPQNMMPVNILSTKDFKRK